MSQWTNSDGLTIFFAAEQGERTVKSAAHVVTFGAKHQMVVDFTYDNLPREVADLDNDGTNDGWSNASPYIPAKSFITNAYLIVTEDWATADSAALTIGLETQEGGTLDADGIDASIAAAALDLGDVVVCDGDLVGGTVWTHATEDGYLKVTNTNTFTTGAARLVIEYITTGDGV